MKRREKKTARASAAGRGFSARFCRFLCVNVRKKRALAWLLSVALLCAVCPLTVFAEEPIDEAPAESIEETVTPEDEPTEDEPTEDEPTEEEPTGEEPTEDESPEDESPEDESPTEGESEEKTADEAPSDEKFPIDGLKASPELPEPLYSITVECTVSPATIDFEYVNEYRWNTETLRYEFVGKHLVIGERNTVNVEISMTSFSTAPVRYEISYADNMYDALTTEATEDRGTIPMPENTELGETVTFSGTVTVTGITPNARITDGDALILGSYTVTVYAGDTITE